MHGALPTARLSKANSELIYFIITKFISEAISAILADSTILENEKRSKLNRSFGIGDKEETVRKNNEHWSPNFILDVIDSVRSLAPESITVSQI